MWKPLSLCIFNGPIIYGNKLAHPGCSQIAKKILRTIGRRDGIGQLMDVHETKAIPTEDFNIKSFKGKYQLWKAGIPVIACLDSDNF